MADLPPTTKIVVTPNPIGVGQSIGGPGLNSNANQPTYDISQLSPNGKIPEVALNGVNPANIMKLFRFPTDTPPYYMQLAINDFSRLNWNQVGTLTETARIILPIPNQLVDNHNIRYETSDVGIAGAVGLDLVNGEILDAIGKAGIGAIQGGLKTLANSTGAFGGAAKQAARGVLAAAGVATNDFMTIMLRGPDYKKRDFIWRLSPKTAQETSDLRRIIQLINNSMAPSLIPGTLSTFFRWPSVWLPEFVYNGIKDALALNTFKMKPSVLTDFSVNYTPNGSFSPFASTKAPTSVEMHMTFLELEFWLKGDFDDQPKPQPKFGAGDGSFSPPVFGGT